MLNERRRRVLMALVDEYVASVQPVGSKVLVERYGLGFSPATVRGELQALEETGHVYQPHVSAGRVPTDSGYRVFVDDVVSGQTSCLDTREAESVRLRFASLEHELSDILRETSLLLSRLTSYVAVVAAPTLSRARIRRVTVVPLGTQRASVVVVTDSGQVANRTVEFDRPVTPETVRRVEEYLSRTLDGAVGEQVEDVRTSMAGIEASEASIALAVLDDVLECLAEADHDRVLTGGVSALLTHPEFSDPEAVRPLVGLLEDGIMMLTVLSDVMRSSSVQVRIGHENPVGALEHASFVAARYGDGESGGIVGLIGPTRMDYRRAISAVRVVSDSLSEVVGL